MYLTYENTIEDRIAFQEYLRKHSPEVKQRLFRLKVIGCLLVALPAGLLFGRDDPLLGLIWAFIGVSLFLLICLPLMRDGIKEQVINHYADGKNKGVICEHGLEIIEGTLIERTEYNETKMPLKAIEGVATTSDHTFIFINSITAITIPHHRIISGDYGAFMAQLGNQPPPFQRLR